MCAPRDCVCRGKTLYSSQRSSCRRPHCTSCTSPESDAAWLPARKRGRRWCSNDASRNFNECSYIQRMSSSLLALLMITHDAPTSMSNDVSSDAKPEQQIVRIPTMEPRPKGPVEERRNHMHGHCRHCPVDKTSATRGGPARMHLRKRNRARGRRQRSTLVNTGTHRPFDESRHERGPGLRPTTTRASRDRNENNRKHINYGSLLQEERRSTLCKK